MKNYQIIITALFLFFSMTFTNCVKENEGTPVPTNNTNIHSGWFKSSDVLGGCHAALGYCLSILDADTDEPLGLSEDESIGTASIKNGQIELVMTKHNLSPEFEEMLTQQQVFLVDRDFQLPENVVSVIYENAGLEAPTTPVNIPAGEYIVTIDESQTSATGLISFIEISIKIGPVKITIKF